MDIEKTFSQEELVGLIEGCFTTKEISDLSIDALGRLLPYRAHPESLFNSPPKYWDLLKGEFRILVCTDDKKYRELRAQLAAGSKKSQVTLVSLISAAMASYVGVAAGILTPFCALCILALVRVGKEAFCSRVHGGALNAQMINDSNSGRV